MQLPDLHIELVMAKLAGIAGALSSLAFIRGTIPERLAMASSGAVLSYYATPWAANFTHLPEGLCGFLLGMFGMAVCAKLWETIQEAPIREIWAAAIDAIKKRFGG